MSRLVIFSQCRPVDRDEIEFRVLRYTDDITEYLGADGEWHEYPPHTYIPALTSITGLEAHKVHGPGLRFGPDFQKSWTVDE